MAAGVTVTQPIGDAADGLLPHLDWQRANGTRFTITGNLARFLDPEVPFHRIEGIEVLSVLQRLADLKEAYGVNVAGVAVRRLDSDPHRQPLTLARSQVLRDLTTLPPDGQQRADGIPTERLENALDAIRCKARPRRAGKIPLTANQVAACVVLGVLKGWPVSDVPMTPGFPDLFIFGERCHAKERIYRFGYEIARDLDPANVTAHVDRCFGCIHHKVAACWSYTPLVPQGACYPCFERGATMCNHGQLNINQLQAADIRALMAVPLGPQHDAERGALVHRIELRQGGRRERL